jgi:hypothetical protein
LTALEQLRARQPEHRAQGQQCRRHLESGRAPIRSRRVNFGKASCTGAPNPNFVDGTSLGGREGCSYDYVAGSQIYPKADKQSLLGRFTAQLDDDNQVFVELMLAKARPTTPPRPPRRAFAPARASRCRSRCRT